MTHLRWGSRFLGIFILTACSTVAGWGAIGPSNVLVLYNQDSPDSVSIANYYAQAHPGVRLLGLTGVTTIEDVTADYYLQTIRPQILPALNSSTDVIVTTKGLPLRIQVTEANPGTYVDPFGVTRYTYGTGWWKSYSSLESELTQIDTVSTWQQMGDQFYNSPLAPKAHPAVSSNPYYQVTSNAPVAFDYNNYYITGNGGMRLTSRLDGYTVTDVEASINRATHAAVIPNGRQIVLDNDPNVSYSRMAELKNNVLIPMNQPYTYDNTTNPVLTAPGPVLGYVSHGTHGGGLNSNYVTNQLNFQLAPGAVFETHESYNASSFQPGGYTHDQGQVAQWLAIGGTAGVGNVQEPLAGTDYEPNEDQMFKMLLKGYTWAESAWSSMRQLSYVNTVVGDPLMTWKKISPGDINMDGIVGSADLALLGANWGKTGQAGGGMWSLGDLNCDGTVGSADLAILGANWGAAGQSVSSNSIVSSSYATDYSSLSDALDSGLFAIPEPSLATLFLIGLASLILTGKLRSFMRFG
jgi:uncharacterized protein (TIGR03790 family)